MNKRCRHALRHVTILLLTSWAFASPATDLQAHIQKSIAQIDTLETNLKEIEIDQADNYRALVAAETALSQKQKVLRALNTQQQKLNKQLSAQQNKLLKALSATYILSRQPDIKILLNEMNPSKLQRVLTYYQLINQSHIKLIHALQTTLHDIEHNETAIKETVANLTTLRTTALNKQKTLRHISAQRTHTLHSLRKQVKADQLQLTQLSEHQQRYDQTVHTVAPTASRGAQPHKGHFPWPLRGRLIAHFGTPIEHSQLRRNGILIATETGVPVHAIAAGRVVFAKWLSGYGLLLIVHHRGGLLSIYGRNQLLIKKVGDTVAKQEVIAYAGKSGGFDRPALYFAIRYNNAFQNPLRWLQRH